MLKIVFFFLLYFFHNQLQYMLLIFQNRLRIEFVSSPLLVFVILKGSTVVIQTPLIHSAHYAGCLLSTEKERNQKSKYRSFLA